MKEYQLINQSITHGPKGIAWWFMGMKNNGNNSDIQPDGSNIYDIWELTIERKALSH
jgi:hypothetical protein